MKRILAAVAAALGLLVSAGQATAAPGDDALQLAAAAQAAASAQGAGAQSGAAQSYPSNKNISVRVLSPGNDGDVTQSNTVGSNATAVNGNVTSQSAGQAQGGSCGCGNGTQATGQSADSSQNAGALSYASQSGASNTNIPVRVLSDGNDGNVEQSNSVASDATAGNINLTGQSAEQAGAGGGTQAVGQQAKNEQDAAAASKAEQKGAKNTNISVRVLSDGDNGNVKQSNDATSSAAAGNLNATGQKAGQGPGSGGTQAIGQKAYNDQSALALSAAKQDNATNTNTPVRVLSDGNGGNVEQSNSVESTATAGNLNATKQEALQGGGRGSEKCGCSSDGTQAIGQSAGSKQSAGALSAALQSGASNTNAPVRVDSKGDDGDVAQSNSVGSRATALNINLTGQKAGQGAQGSGDCYCGAGTQAIGQSAWNDQTAGAASLAAQTGGGKDRCGCGSSGNTNAPVRIDSDSDRASKRGAGSVEQSNSVGSSAGAGNLNLTGQSAEQAQGGGGTQAIGQEAKNRQGALALSAALQAGASNSNTPVRVDSDGNDGSVKQSNSVGSSAGALNGNLTKQEAGQLQAGAACGCDSTGIQAIGQKADSQQGAGAFSLGLQLGASNRNAPVRVDSKGGGGSVEQSNTVGSSATALNLNALGQSAAQAQGGGGILVQAIGQKAKNEQEAIGLSAALQSGASNSSTPVAIGGKGDKYGKHDTYDKHDTYGKDRKHDSCGCEKQAGGSVKQSNDAASAAKALNGNLLHQGAVQHQDGGRCGCDHHVGVQALGQSAHSAQGALSASLALQCGSRKGLTTDSPHGYTPHAAPTPRKESYC